MSDQTAVRSRKRKVGKKGVVRDPAVHREVIEMVTAYAQSISFCTVPSGIFSDQGTGGEISSICCT